MPQIIECVPNFSEGRDRAIINAITKEIENTEGVKLLDVDPGADTNRTPAPCGCCHPQDLKDCEDDNILVELRKFKCTKSSKPRSLVIRQIAATEFNPGGCKCHRLSNAYPILAKEEIRQ